MKFVLENYRIPCVLMEEMFMKFVFENYRILEEFHPLGYNTV
jgi:hypothetical protein